MQNTSGEIGAKTAKGTEMSILPKEMRLIREKISLYFLRLCYKNRNSQGF